MTLPINYLTVFMAFLPIFVFVFLMIFKWRVSDAAPVSLLIALFSSYGVFRAPALLIAVEGSKGTWNSIVAVALLWTAALFYRILCQAEFEPDNKNSAAYHRGDAVKHLIAEAEDDLKEIDKKKSRITYVVLAVSILLSLAAFSAVPELKDRLAVGYMFPENSTGYGVKNAAESCYSPLSVLIGAALIIGTADIAGLIILGIRGQLRHGGLLRVLRKSAEAAFPVGVAVCAVMTTVSLMSGTGQIYALTIGNVMRVDELFCALLIVMLAPIVYSAEDTRSLSEKRRIAEAIRAGAEKQKRDSRREADIIIKRPRFYSTREGAFCIAFWVAAFAFVLVAAGLWGDDTTLVLDGFAAIVTAMVFCPIRTYILDRAAAIAG
ncbi:MAG: hypothetical protein PUC98_03905 [Clostridiales bacterium]|nr:hypothetical protein [Clostridiales bacterium]